MHKLNDKKIQEIIDLEYNRQQNELELIASENYVSTEVMKACSNVFTNKYSEGYPGRRYYGGQVNVDTLERITQYRALKIFGLIEDCNEDDENDLIKKLSENKRGANVQPLSGSPANLAVYLGTLKPGDTILGMDLNAGGHLSHGYKLNASGSYYNIVEYGVKEDDLTIDYEHLLSQALKHKPSMILAGYSAYSRLIDWKKFEEVANKVEEKHGYRPILMADIAHIAGLIAGGAIEGPFENFDIITTTTHKTLRGPRGALIIGKSEFMKKINRGVFPGLQGGPHEHLILAKAIAFGEILNGDFEQYAEKVIKNAKILAEELKNYGWDILTGGTDNHIVIFDTTKKHGKETNLSGKIAEEVLEKIGISCNKNLLPFDKRPPLDPSGIRLGTPAITTRGLGENEIKEIAKIINIALHNHENEIMLQGLKNEIQSICNEFPLNY